MNLRSSAVQVGSSGMGATVGVAARRALITVRAAQAKSHGLAIVFRQSNREGEIVDHLQEARTSASAVIINPAGYGHTSIAILDSIQALKIPVIEVHLSNIHKREAFRHNSYVSKGATGIVMGLGAQGYLRAVDAIAEILAPTIKSRSK